MKYFCCGHNVEEPHIEWEAQTQSLLEATTLLIGHNIKGDLMWLREVGFVYSGPLYDTMIMEYILAEGQHVELGLHACCGRYGIEGKKDTVAEYWAKKINTDDVPWAVLEEYGVQDIESTWNLFHAQLARIECKAEEFMQVLK